MVLKQADGTIIIRPLARM